MSNFLIDFTNKDTIFKIAIGVGILLGVIILLVFIRKHKAIFFTLLTVVVLLVGFYFLNSIYGFQFTNDLSRDSIRDDFDSDDYFEIKIKDKTIYTIIAFDENGKLINDTGDFFCVEKKLFFYVEDKPKTYTYEGNNNTVTVKEIKTADGYFYSIDYNNSKVLSLLGMTTITKVYPETVVINGKTLDVENLFFVESEDKISTLSIGNTEYTLVK